MLLQNTMVVLVSRKPLSLIAWTKIVQNLKENLPNSPIVVSEKRIFVSGKFLCLPNENIAHLSPI